MISVFTGVVLKISRTPLSIGLALLVILFCGPVLAAKPLPAATDEPSDVGDKPSGSIAAPYSGRGQQDIIDRWKALKPKANGSIYNDQPSWQEPYTAGSLSADHHQDGVNSVNFMRYLAGLPDDVVAHEPWMEEAQHAAVLLKSAGCLTHRPPQLAGITDPFYDLACKACSSSNLAYGFSQTEDVVRLDTAADSVVGFMNERGNEQTVGHRRWILNPAMKKTAFGWCESYSVMKAFDRSRSLAFQYNLIAWPPPGDFPQQLCPQHLPWSVSLNHNHYRPTGQETVTMVRQRDNKTWQLSVSNKPADGLFLVDSKGFGVPYCIIFRPDKSLNYLPADRFKITITGLEMDGAAAEISYTTTLFDMPEIVGS